MQVLLSLMLLFRQFSADLMSGTYGMLGIVQASSTTSLYSR